MNMINQWHGRLGILSLSVTVAIALGVNLQVCAQDSNPSDSSKGPTIPASIFTPIDGLDQDKNPKDDAENPVSPVLQANASTFTSRNGLQARQLDDSSNSKQGKSFAPLVQSPTQDFATSNNSNSSFLPPISRQDSNSSRPPIHQNGLRSNNSTSPQLDKLPPSFQDHERGLDQPPVQPQNLNMNRAGGGFGGDSGFKSSLGDLSQSSQQQETLNSTDLSRRNQGPQSFNPQNLRPPVTQSPTGVAPAQFQQPIRPTTNQNWSQPGRGIPGAQRQQPPQDRMARLNPVPTRSMPSPPSFKAPLVKQLMDRYDIDSVTGPLPGKPTRLLEMLESTPTQLRRSMINQYWETFYDWARLQNANAEVEFLNKVNPSQVQTDRIMLNVARSAANNRVLSDEIQLEKSQSQLHEFVKINRDDLPPLPSDMPLLQKYDAHYEWFNSRGMMPNRLKGIDRVLPKTLQLISNRAETARAAKAAMNQIHNAYQSGQSNLPSVLEATRIWANAERNLIASVVSYNQAISDYSMSVSKRQRTPQQIVDMLITKPTPKLATAENQIGGQGNVDRQMQNRSANLRNSLAPTPVNSNPQRSFQPPAANMAPTLGQNPASKKSANPFADQSGGGMTPLRTTPPSQPFKTAPLGQGGPQPDNSKSGGGGGAFKAGKFGG